MCKIVALRKAGWRLQKIFWTVFANFLNFFYTSEGKYLWIIKKTFNIFKYNNSKNNQKK